MGQVANGKWQMASSKRQGGKSANVRGVAHKQQIATAGAKSTRTPNRAHCHNFDIDELPLKNSRGAKSVFLYPAASA